MINDGGPAFPQGHLEGPHVDPSGMSLRDYFAAKAMQGIHASCDLGNWPKPIWIAEAAKCACATADAMLAAREANNGQA